jgi:hypothetical protein
VLDDDEAKTLWKAHFANQITLAEKSIMLIFQSQHLTNAEIKHIPHLSEGEFNEKTLQKLVTKLSSTFEPYKPDKAIMQYLNRHTRQLEAPSFASPKEKQNTSNKFERRKSSSSDRKKNTTDRSDKNESDQTFPISKRNLAEDPAIKR